jgi:hypothetical protein
MTPIALIMFFLRVGRLIGSEMVAINSENKIHDLSPVRWRLQG